MTRKYLLLFVFMATISDLSLSQQEFRLISNSPSPVQLNVSAQSPIRLNFSQPVDSENLPASPLIVLGDKRGKYSGTVTFEDQDQTLVFTPALNFSAGEKINVFVNRNIVDNNDQPLDAAHSFSFTTATWNAHLNFQPAVSLPLDNVPYPTLLSPHFINGDNYFDFVIGCNREPFDPTPARIAILRGLNLDGSGYTVEILNAGVSPSSFMLAPFDQDSLVDLMSVDYYGGVLKLYHGKVDSFAHSFTSVAFWDEPIGASLSDFDGDGDIDICVTGQGDGIGIYKNRDGVFDPEFLFSTGLPVRWAEWGDVNNDGRIDLVAAEYLPYALDNNLAVYLNNDNSNFGLAQTSNLSDYTVYFELHDFDSDGDLDVACVQPLLQNQESSFNGRIEILKNDGEGHFSPHQNTHSGANIPIFLTAADFNGDGDIDIITSNSGTNVDPDSTVTIMLNQGDGTFSRYGKIQVGRSPKGLCAIDVNEDGRMDLAVVTGDPPAFHVFLAEVETAVEGPEPPGGPLTFEIRPNPFRNQAELRIDGQSGQSREMDVFDLLGRKIFSTVLQNENGLSHFIWDGHDQAGGKLPAGIYWAVVHNNTERVVKKLVLIR